MKKMICTLALCFLAQAATAPDPPVPYPEGYRHWNHLHSTIVGPKHTAFAKHPCESPCTGGIYHFYANDKAMEAFRTGGTFADGSIIADEVLETHQQKSGASTEGARRAIGVMVKDSHLYAATGGWGYDAFDGETKAQNLSAQERHDCYQCHVPKKDRDYVFTVYHER
jgi:hypothetical protein